MWQVLRSRRLQGFKFRRQFPVAGYIVDFVCLSEGLILEADGSQHADNKDDARRDAFLRNHGFRVLRFWNNEVLGLSARVGDAIFAALQSPHPPKPAAWVPPSPARGEGMPGPGLRWKTIPCDLSSP